MRFFIGSLLSLILFVDSARAQELIGIKIEPAEVPAGSPVQITLDFTASTVPNGACGLLVNFGDGTSQQIRVENSSLPIRLSRTYNNVGSIAVVAEGKLFPRGLATVLGCFGKNQSAALTVRALDPSEREAAEIAAKKEAVLRATADRKAAEIAARSAAIDRAATEAAAQKARVERAAADNAAKRAMAERIAAEQKASVATQTKPVPSPGASNVNATQSPPSRAIKAPTVAPKSSQPKAKSSLDL